MTFPKLSLGFIGGFWQLGGGGRSRGVVVKLVFSRVGF